MRVTAIILCLAMVLGTLAGCTSEQSYVPTGHGLEGQEPAGTEPNQPPVSDDGVQKPDKSDKIKEFTLAYYPDEGFNPYTCTSFQNRMLFSLLYQGLFSVDRNYTPVPVLCKSYTVSSDFRTHTFEIEAATFSDGTRLTADDVVASLKKAEDTNYYEGRFDNIGKITALSETEIQITTYTAYENLPLLLDVPIVKASQLDELMPLGTGPYTLKKTAAGMALQLRGNWWCDVKLPLDAVSIPLMVGTSPAQIRDSFEFDNLGISISDPGSSSYAEYRCDYELWEAETGIFLYLGCNKESAVFSNDVVRAALTYAIDRVQLLEKCYHGFGAVATLPASPGSPFYDRGLAGKISYEPEKLRQAIKAEGLEGASVVLLVNKSDSVRLQTARMIVNMLTACGLNVTLQDNSTRYYKEMLMTDEWDLYLGQTRLSANMDLSPFFAPYGALSYGDMDNAAAYSMAQAALENSGNFYNLHQMVLQDGQLVPILFRTYAIYGRRGLANDLEPSRDNVFFYSLGKTLEDVMTVEIPDEE